MDSELVASVDFPGLYVLFAVNLLDVDAFDLVLGVVGFGKVTRQLILKSAEFNVGLLDSKKTYLDLLFRHDVANVKHHLLLFFLALTHHHQLAARHPVIVLFLRLILSNHLCGNLGLVRQLDLDGLDEDAFVDGVLESGLYRVGLVNVFVGKLDFDLGEGLVNVANDFN